MKESVNDSPLAQIPMSRKKKIGNGIAKNVKKSKSHVDANKRQEMRQTQQVTSWIAHFF